MPSDLASFLKLADYGLAVILVGYLIWRDKLFAKTLQSHFHASETAFREMMRIVEENSRAIQAITSAIQRCPNNR